MHVDCSPERAETGTSVTENATAGDDGDDDVECQEQAELARVLEEQLQCMLVVVG